MSVRVHGCTRKCSHQILSKVLYENCSKTLPKRTGPEVQGINTLFKTQTRESYTLSLSSGTSQYSDYSGTVFEFRVGDSK